jgi:hypothetical protein
VSLSPAAVDDGERRLHAGTDRTDIVNPAASGYRPKASCRRGKGPVS